MLYQTVNMNLLQVLDLKNYILRIITTLHFWIIYYIINASPRSSAG